MTDISPLVGRILHPDASIESRAIALFEFQVLVYFPGPNPTSTDPSDKIDERDRYSKRAQVFAGSRILDRAWKKLRIKSEKGELFGILDAAHDAQFAKLFDEYVGRGNSMRELRNTPNGTKLRKLLEKKRKASVPVGRLVDFCLCYYPLLAKRHGEEFTRGNRPLGIENLKSFLDSEKDIAEQIFGRPWGKTMLGRFWGTFGQSATFIYLINNSDVGLDFPNCREGSFVSDLLELVDDTEHLRRFFGLHEAIRESLRSQGYSFPSTGVPALPFKEVPVSMKYDSEVAELL